MDGCAAETAAEKVPTWQEKYGEVAVHADPAKIRQNTALTLCRLKRSLYQPKDDTPWQGPKTMTLASAVHHGALEGNALAIRDLHGSLALLTAPPS